MLEPFWDRRRSLTSTMAKAATSTTTSIFFFPQMVGKPSKVAGGDGSRLYEMNRLHMGKATITMNDEAGERVEWVWGQKKKTETK